MKPGDSLDPAIPVPVPSSVMSSLVRNGLIPNGLKPDNAISSNPSLPVIRPLGPGDLKACAALSLDRGWWPERGKWALLLEASDGWAIDAPDGEGLAGTVILTKWGTGRAGLGMMLTASRYGGQGYGRALMEHALNAAGEDCAVSLFATDSGRPLYDKLGFQSVRRSVAFRGRFRPAPPADSGKKREARDEAAAPAGRIRPVTEADLPQVIALDLAAYGADRERMLSRLPAFAERFLVLETDEGIVGYAAGWRTEAFLIVGPLMAPDGESAKRLVTEVAADSPVAIRLDIDPDRPELPAWARSCGLLPTERTVMMTHGDQTRRGTPDLLYTPISVAMC